MLELSFLQLHVVVSMNPRHDGLEMLKVSET